VDIKEFWKEYDLSEKEHQKWKKRADKVTKRFRQETDSGDGAATPSFNILWANTEVQKPALFSQVPKPNIQRRYKDDDPIGKQGSDVLSRALQFVMDDGDFFTFGDQSVTDYLLPGRTVCKVRYCPTYSRVRKAIPVDARGELGPNGEDDKLEYYLDDDKLDPAEVKRYNEGWFVERDIEEVVDEQVEIDRWPWDNFRHQKAKRWKDVGWIDYISYLDKDQLKRTFGRKGLKVKLSVDASGDDGHTDGGAASPTHAEIHEIWFLRERKVRIAAAEGSEWLKESDDPLRLQDFYPTPTPLMAVETNDSLVPIPLFAMYQHQANELDKITKRITVLMGALKLAGLYAGDEKSTLQRLFEADENVMVPVGDWGAIKAAGGVNGLVEWLPIDQVAKVLQALFREREALVAQVYELTGIADIQRGATDPRETKGAQVLKAQFSSRRTLSPQQKVEFYFRDVLRLAAEIMAEHFSTDTLQRMTGIQIAPQTRQMLQDDLQRQYRIDIETDSTIAPDEEAEQQNMAQALEAVTSFITAMGPLIQQGLPIQLALSLLKTYLRKFNWGQEIENMLDELQRNPPAPKPDPEAQKAQMEMQQKQQQAQLDAQQQQQEMAMKMQELQLKVKEMEMKLQFEQAQAQQELVTTQVQAQSDQQIAQNKVFQQQVDHDQKLRQGEESHQQAMMQQREKQSAQNVQVRSRN
jgi:hypothetical protein